MEKNVSALAHNNYMMKQLGVKAEIITMVEKETMPLVYEWMYLCAVDGMPEETMKKLSELPNDSPTKKITAIRNYRLKFLAEKFGNNVKLNQKVEELETMVEKINKDASDTIERFNKINAERIADLRGQVVLTERLMNATIEEKEKTIKDKADRILALEEEVRQLRSDIQGKSEEDRTNAKKVDAVSNQPLADIDIPVQKNNFLKRLRRRWNHEDKKFIEKYLEDERYTDEQREFILKCFEAGMTTKDIDQFASPSVDISMMRRLMLARKVE